MRLFKGRKKKVEARRVGSTLVVSLSFNEPSLVWQFDLEKNHSFAINLKHREGGWDLGVSGTRGEFTPVTHFADYDAAEATLVAIQKAMLRASGSHKAAPSLARRIISSVLLIVFGLFLALGYAAYSFGSSLLHNGIQGQQTSGAQAPRLLPREGVPMKADDVLRLPRK